MKSALVLASIILAMVLPAFGQVGQVNVSQEEYNANAEALAYNDQYLMDQIEGIKNGSIPVPFNGSVAAGPSITNQVIGLVKDYLNTTTPSNGTVVNTPATGGVIAQAIEQVTGEDRSVSEAPTAVPSVLMEVKDSSKGNFQVTPSSTGAINIIATNSTGLNIRVGGEPSSMLNGEGIANMQNGNQQVSAPAPVVQTYEQTVFPVVYSGEERGYGSGQSFAQEVNGKLSQGRQPVVTGQWNFVNGVRVSFTPIYGGPEQARLHRNPVTGADEAEQA